MPLLAAFGVLSALALFVVWFLPGYMAAQNGDSAAPVTEAVQPAPAPPAAEADSDRAEAERLQADALRRFARLENEGGRVWAVEPVAGRRLADTEEILRKANAAYDRRLYSEAVALFRDSVVALDHLLDSKPERLRLSLARGQSALDAQDATSALRHFEIAAALAPGDPAAAAGRERARKLPDVLTQIKLGQDAEAAGNLHQARTSYQEALSLDPSSELARGHLARVERQITADSYRGAISEAFAQLDKGDLRAAEAALERARRLDPKAPELAEIRQRLQSASKVAALQQLRTQIYGLERQEKWAEAVKLYNRALALDPAAAFASTGRPRAQFLSNLHAAIDAYIAQPERLQSADPLAHAKSLLTADSPSGDEGQQLAAKKRRLADLIAQAQTPVSVMFRSDESTEVTINRVAKLGVFNARHVDLPPGKYVAVGSRVGYRDVRVMFEVSANAANQPVIVQCTEPIQ